MSTKKEELYKLAENLTKHLETNLHQCPCCPAATCKMDEPCLGCETYAEWLKKEYPEPEKCNICGKNIEGNVTYQGGWCCRECFWDRYKQLHGKTLNK